MGSTLYQGQTKIPFYRKTLPRLNSILNKINKITSRGLRQQAVKNTLFFTEKLVMVTVKSLYSLLDLDQSCSGGGTGEEDNNDDDDDNGR
jgi:hypothetical protein